MTAYELMIKTNHYLIKGEILTENQKQNIVGQFLSAQSSSEQAQRFYKGVKFPNNIDAEGRRMYPVFYIPPYNEGKKCQTVIPVSPKSHILASNSYELEIIRLLHLFTPENTDVRNMVNETLKRLKTTCFGYKSCYLGECFESSIVVLRFLATVAPAETEWINKLVFLFQSHFKDKRRHGNVIRYFWLCLSELPIDIAKPEILHYKNDVLMQLRRSFIMNNENDKTNHPLTICVLRNVLARLPEYSHIKDSQPIMCEKDGRLYFDINTHAV